MTEHRYTACGGVIVEGHRVLVLLRPSRDEVRLPKGHIETGESPEQAALREVREETGYAEVDITVDLGEQVVEFDHDGLHCVRTERYFLMTLRDPERRPEKRGEAQFQPSWFCWEEALDALTYDAEKAWVRRARDYVDGRKNRCP